MNNNINDIYKDLKNLVEKTHKIIVLDEKTTKEKTNLQENIKVKIQENIKLKVKENTKQTIKTEITKEIFSAKFALGDKVMAGLPEWGGDKYPGEVHFVNGNGTYGIRFDDGDQHPAVPEALMHLLGEEAAEIIEKKTQSCQTTTTKTTDPENHVYVSLPPAGRIGTKTDKSIINWSHSLRGYYF